VKSALFLQIFTHPRRSSGVEVVLIVKMETRSKRKQSGKDSEEPPKKKYQTLGQYLAEERFERNSYF
jgi:hypothetical protein